MNETTISAIRLNAAHYIIESRGNATPVQYMQPTVCADWMKRLHVGLGKIGLRERPDKLAFLAVIYGEEFESSKLLNIGQIRAILQAIATFPEDLYEATR